MNYNDLDAKLKDIKIEEFVWIIYIGIIIYSFYSNSLEKKYLLTGNTLYKKKYRETLIVIFSILTIIYYYFFKDSYNSVVNLKEDEKEKTKNLTYLSYLASTLIFVSGIIFLYIAYNDENIDVEIAFN